MSFLGSLFNKKKLDEEDTDMIKLICKSGQMEDFLEKLSKDKRLSEEERADIGNYKKSFEWVHKWLVASLSGDIKNCDELGAELFRGYPQDMESNSEKSRIWPEIINNVKKKVTKEEGKLLDFTYATYSRDFETWCAHTCGISGGKWIPTFKTRPHTDFIDKYSLEKLQRKYAQQE